MPRSKATLSKISYYLMMLKWDAVHNNLEEYYKKFIQFSTNELYNEKITKSYNALKLVGKGYSSPKFVERK